MWLTEQGSDKLGRWDPKTEKITEYQDDGAQAHGQDRSQDGMVWSTGALTRFDPKTEKFDHIPDVPTATASTLDAEGNAWFTELLPNGKIGKVDAKTLKVTKYTIPTQGARPRRIVVDGDGIVWFAEFEAGKIGRFDPEDRDASRSCRCPGRRPRPTRSASMPRRRSGTRRSTWT